MAHVKTLRLVRFACALALAGGQAFGQNSGQPTGEHEQLQALQKENAKLQEELRRQQQLMEDLDKKVQAIQQASKQNGQALNSLEAESEEHGDDVKRDSSFGLNRVSISGEGAAGFLKTESQGAFSKGDFKLDEAKLFVETPIHDNIYFYTELNLALHDEPDLSLQLGEAYLDFEGVSRLWNQERTLNLRLGRMDIPFGEEYMEHDAIDDPLISHSLVDLWGVDVGIEAYGTIGPVSYVASVQNGGYNTTDFTTDKAVTLRLSADPKPWLHVSASAMRTGNNSSDDEVSATWFGGGWFVPYGGATRFHAELVEGDARIVIPHGYVQMFGGYIRYDNNGPAGPTGRDIYYYSAEAVRNIFHKVYGAARFSQIFAAHGFPIVGNGTMHEYLFAPTTDEIWRLSLGLGYRLNHNLTIKGEYTFEHGREINGGHRDHEDLVGVEAAYKF